MPPDPAPRRRGDVQGLRGVAVLLVVLYHGGGRLHGGFTGVDVFFVISGYVITLSLLRGGLHLGQFYIRRVRRLLPAFAVMTSLVLLSSAVLAPISAVRTTALTGAWASFYASNIFLYRFGTGYFDVSSSLDPLVHTWTLAVEEQFYVVFPICLVLMFRWGGGRRSAAALFAGLSAASFAFALALSHGAILSSHPQQFAFYGSPPRAWEFGVGATLALLGTPRRLSPLLGTLGLALVVFGGVRIAGTSGYPSWDALLPVGGAALALAAPTPLLALQPLVWLGDISYSLYLWHWPLIVFASALYPNSATATTVGAALSFVPAWLSYRFVEEPIRHRAFAGRAALRLAVVCLGVPLAASAALGGVDRLVDRSAAGRAYAAAEAAHLDVTRGCEGPHLGVMFTPACTWRVAHPRGTVLLVGDSNASHFSEAFVDAAAIDRYDARIATYFGCPFADLLVYDSAGAAACRSFDTRLLAAIAATRPSLVFIAARDDGYVDGHIPLAAPGERPTTDSRQRARVWRRGVLANLRRLHELGIPALLVEPVPAASVDIRECAVIRILSRACGASTARRAPLPEPRLAPHRSLDLRSALCSRASCSISRRGVFLYHDPDHLSVSAATVLTPVFAHAIRSYAAP